MSWLFLLLCYVFSLISISCNAQNCNKNGLLWKISGNELTQPSYLFGTFHGTYGVSHEFSERIVGFNEAFGSVKQFVGEKKPNSELLKKPFGEQFMPKDTTYRDILSEKDFVFVDSILKSIGAAVPLDKIPLRPKYMGYVIQREMLEKKLKRDNLRKRSEKVMDGYLMDLAQSKGYNMEGLDDSIENTDTKNISINSLRKDADDLVIGIKSMLYTKDERAIHLISKLEEAYIAQDLDGIYQAKIELDELIYEYSGDNNEAVKKQREIIVGRNLKWIEILPQMLRNDPAETVN